MNGPELDERASVPDAVATVDGVDVDYDALERIGPIGSGSNATVYEARVADRRIALKEPSVDAPAVADRFVREARTWERVADHDHVVGVVDWGPGEAAEGTDGPWLALELMDGGDLRERGHLELGEALWIARCLTDAVAHAHDEGVVHLDLTPDNVLFRSVEEGWDVPKVGDWGLARLVGDAADVDGMTPPYAAPEQFESGGGDALDERTDVYQLGAVLYRVLTGEAPYTGTPSAVEAAVLDGDPPRPTSVDPSIPDRLDAVVARAMATDPADRYETAGALRDDVDDLLAAVTEDGSGGADGSTTGTALESQGFERVTEGYFEGREPASPSAAWRAGLDLVDVHEGYAVERQVERDGERVSLSHRLLDRLEGGSSVAVVGAPGAGKSTVCKQVACEWFESGRGPVLYRESGLGQRLDAPATLRRYLDAVEGNALVVVEDAVRGEASAVFDAIDAVEDDPDVSVLLDARRSEWSDAGRHLDRERERVRQRAVAVEFLSPPDRAAYERFVAAVERSAEADLDVTAAELVPDIRGKAAGEQGQPGELFLLLHRLLSRLDTVAGDGDEGVTTLDEAVRMTRLDLERRGETFLNVGVAANLLNAAGVGVRPELLHAAAPDEEAAVAEAIDALDGRALFLDEDTSGVGPYRAVHEVWSAEFLAAVLEAEGEDAAHERFGGVLSRILALADDPERRDDVAWVLRGETEYLDRVARAPGEWADAVVEDVFAVGKEWPKLAPMYGTTDASAIDLPDACSGSLDARRSKWRGHMYIGVNRYDRAEREYERLRTLADDGDVEGFDPETVRLRGLVGIGRVHKRRREYDRAREQFEEALHVARRTDDRDLEASVLMDLGRVAGDRGRFDQAREYLTEALAIERESGTDGNEASVLLNLGVIESRQNEYDRATEYLERALGIAREIGDRKREADVFINLGIVALDRSEFDRARNYYERALDIVREIGNRDRVSKVLNNLGTVARDENDYEGAREFVERSLEIKRDLDDSHGQANSLGVLGQITTHQGQYDRARGYFEDVIELSEDMGAKRIQTLTHNEIGIVDVRRGEYERARDHFDRSRRMASELGVPNLEAHARTNLGVVAGRRREFDLAREHVESALDVYREIENDQKEAYALVKLGGVALEADRIDEADRCLDRALERFDDLGDRLGVARAALRSGQVALAQGDTDAAREHVGTARETFAELEARHWLARSRRRLGDVASVSGDPDLACEHRQAALAVFEDVGAWEDSLATLEDLVETCRQTGDDGPAQEWCERARETLADAPEEVADRHREWVDRHAAALSAD